MPGSFAAVNIAIVIPAFNEELTIHQTILDYHTHLPQASIYVVDNNSQDATNRIARSSLISLNCPGTVLFEKRQGKANAIRKAFLEVEADIYVMVDADLTYPAKEIQRLLDPVLRAEADMVIGDRHRGGSYQKENKRKFHASGNRLVRFLVNFLFGARLTDIMSGCRVFNKFFVKNYPILCSGFELETEMTVHALDKKFSVLEVPIAYQDRPRGSASKLNTIPDGIKVIKTIFWIFKDYRPLLFFGFFAFLFGGLSFLVGFPVIQEFIQTRYVLRVPSAILATGFSILSLLSLSVAFVLDTVVKTNRQNYELTLMAFCLQNKKKQLS